MNREDVLKAFNGLSPEDQAAIRDVLGFDPMAMCKTMMQKIQTGEDPMSVCKEMMGMLSKSRDGGCRCC